MKSVLRMRHYCDFCKKATGTKKSMERHEGSCTNNAARTCRMCIYGGLEQQPMAALVEANTKRGFVALKELAQDCPACILAAQRQTDWNALDDNRPDDNDGWDFKKASEAFLADHRPECAQYY